MVNERIARVEANVKRRILSLLLAVTLVISVVSPAYAAEYTRYDRETQPSVRHTFDVGELGVVNFETSWGNKEANVSKMISYINEAEEKGVKILLFPEMCVSGYASSSNPDSDIYKMAVSSAETTKGKTATTIAKLADDYDMWIVYGATEVIPDDDDHAYNSAFACSPEGEVTSYQKIAPVEGSWATPGETPQLLDAGEYGMIGLSICYDTYAMPEIERYYAANGCNLLLNPTATSRSFTDIDGDSVRDDIGWEWYYKNRLESISSREGFLVMSSNLVNGDGPQKADGSYTYNFPGGSVIIGSGPKYYAGTTTNDGKTNTKADIVTAKEGLLTNEAKVTASTGSTCSNQDFAPEYYAKWYDELADKQEAGKSLSYSSKVTNGPRAAVVNMSAAWGDKEANIKKMKEYVEEAADKGVEFLVFPETVLTGYEWKSESEDSFYKKYGVAMQVQLAETVPGNTTNIFSELAKKYNMYIIFGMPQKADEAIYDQGVEKVYNAAAICKPDGSVDSYQKIHRAGYESKWSVCGNTPYMLETPWGKLGLDICRDGHFYPELGRYYAAMGCTLFIHPTATTGNPWYRETRIGSYTDRDGMAAVTCNLLGGDGTYDESTGTWSGGVFASTSLIITKYIDPATGRTGFNKETGSAISLNGTGSESEGFAERGTSPEGLEIADMNLTGCGFRLTNFNARLYSKMYDQLAVKYRAGYQSIYETTTPSETPTATPAAEPSATPSATPTATPTTKPTAKPTVQPTKTPSVSVGRVEGLKQSDATASSIKLSWKKQKGVTGYDVERYNAKTDAYERVKKIKSNSTTYTDKAVAAGTTYKYRVRAYNLVNGTKYYGKYSKALKTTTEPAKVKTLNAKLTKGKAKLSWSKVNGASGYQVYRATSKNGKYKLVKTVSKNANRSIIVKQSGKTAYYKVRAYRTVDSKQYYGSYSEVKKLKK